jgi:hypothetical protein
LNRTDKELKSIVLFTPASWDHPLVKLRITGPAEFANLQVNRGNEGLQIHPELVSQSDIVIIQRDFPRIWQEYQQVIQLARQYGKPVLFEIDDLLLSMPEDHSHRGEHIGALAAMLYAVIDADMVTCSSKALMDYLTQFNPNTYLLPNYLNDHLWNLHIPRSTTNSQDRITIGYMGGETHQLDLEGIQEVLLGIVEKFKGKVTLRFWGGKPPEVFLESPYTDWIQIYEENYTEFVNFFNQQRCDICIAPLRDNQFNNAKSALKFLEYSALGFPGVYSAMEPYKEVVVHGTNGYLAASQADWEKYLLHLIEHQEVREQIALQAQKTLTGNLLLSHHYQEWLTAYQSAIALVKVQSNASHKQTSQPLLNILSQIVEYQSIVEYNLDETTYRLKDILNSRSWQWMQKLQRVRLYLFPKGSHSEQILFNRKDDPDNPV